MKKKYGENTYMSKTIEVQLPRNINEIDLPLFDPFKHYSLEELKVDRLEEVFVSYSGLCIGENGLVKESHHSYPEKQQQFLDEAVYFYRQAYNDPNNLIELEDDNFYLLIHHPWSSNYWHWMSEAILRLWMVREDLHGMILLLPEHFQKLEFVQSSLKPFHFKDIYYIPFNKSLMVRNLCLPQIKPIADSYYANDLRSIREFYLEYSKGLDRKTFDVVEKIYISRKKASKRKVENEGDVELLLEKYGFKCIQNEDYNFFDQIALFSNAKYLVSIHGAGLTNMLFMARNSVVLELHKKKTNPGDWHSFAFWYMADALGFRYHQQVCDPTDPEAHFFNADFKVDMDLLEENVKFMLA